MGCECVSVYVNVWVRVCGCMKVDGEHLLKVLKHSLFQRQAQHDVMNRVPHLSLKIFSTWFSHFS